MEKLKGKTVLVVIGGGISSYKVLDYIRRLREREVEVIAVMTRASLKFVTRLSVEVVSDGNIVLSDDDDMIFGKISHIECARRSDLVVVLPATASRMSKLRIGDGSDLAGSLLLSYTGEVLLVPAMNPSMWGHVSVRENVEILGSRGYRIAGPISGKTACGEEGMGKMGSVESIVQSTLALLLKGGGAGERHLDGYKALVTSGATRERLDLVRYMSNHSSGLQGQALALALWASGASTTLVTGSTGLAESLGVRELRVESGREMLAVSERELHTDNKATEIVVGVAAVADWRPQTSSDGKLAKSQIGSTLELSQNPDVLRTLLQDKRIKVSLGFAAEDTSNLEELQKKGERKREQKGCTLLAVNDISGDVFGSQENRIILLNDKGTIKDLGHHYKEELASYLVSCIGSYLGVGES